MVSFADEPLLEGVFWDWGASLTYYASNTVPGWGTNVAVMQLVPDKYNLTVAGLPG